MSTATPNAPRTVGPNLAALTVRERAAAAWAEKATEDRHKAERAAINLARSIFGNEIEVTFDEFVSDDFRRRHGLSPRQIVTFEVEGLEFNYLAQTKDRHEGFWLIDLCQCGRGPRLLSMVRSLSDLGLAFDSEYARNRVKCWDCDADERRAAQRTVNLD